MQGLLCPGQSRVASEVVVAIQVSCPSMWILLVGGATGQLTAFIPSRAAERSGSSTPQQPTLTERCSRQKRWS